MIDVSKETNVRFLRAAVAHLQERLLLETRRNLELTAAKALDEELCQRLAEELLVLRKKFFVGGREKADRLRPGKKDRKGRRLLPHNQPPTAAPTAGAIELDSEEIVYADEAATCTCSEPMQPMTGGFEESCEIDVTERKYVLRRHKRQKYVCRVCSRIVAAAGPAKLTPGGEFSIHMAVQVADEKFSRHLPLNRQAERMAEHGLAVDTKTLFSLTELLAGRLGAVPPMIRAEILARPCVSIDESPMKLLATDQNGYVWSISNNHGAYYQYETTRSGKVAGEMLAGFRGTVMCDGYGGYDFLQAKPGVSVANCWAHVRRAFHDAKANYREAAVAVDIIDELYAVEREAHDLAETATLRAERSTSILARFEAFLDSRRGKYLDSSGFGKAVRYYEARRERLARFITDANVPLDNNVAERSQRAPVMGRNNFQGFRTINGADVGMTFYTIVTTCKLMGVVPSSYMLVMGTRAAKGEPVVTPRAWAAELTEQARTKISSLEAIAGLG